MPSRNVSTSILDDICHDLKILERMVFQLQNRRMRTIPIYDKDHLPNDLPNGLLFFTLDSEQFGMVIDDSLYYADTEETVL
jgi:hypothetical protein